MSAARKTTMMMCDERQDIMRREKYMLYLLNEARSLPLSIGFALLISFNVGMSEFSEHFLRLSTP